MKKVALLFSMILICPQLFAQPNSNYSWSYALYLGASNMLGDLGGSDYENVASFRDVDPQATRPAIGLGITRHRNAYSLGVNVMATQLVGSDANTAVDGRSNRNLSVNTDLVEVNGMVDYLPFSASRSKLLNRISLSGGVGLAYYQPKVKYNNQWIKLQPLGTEGQNFLQDKKKYQRVTMVVPVSVGYTFLLGRYTTARLDFSYRQSFSDYLDDVSSTYANTGLIASSGGEMAAILADRSYTGMSEGDKRGNNKNKDGYLLIGIKLQRTSRNSRANDCQQFDEKRRPVFIN